MKRVIVLSFGGSLINLNDLDVRYLKNFKKIILNYSKKFKFVIVCGGGVIARKYIHGLKKLGVKSKFQDLSAISITRSNARFMNYFFNLDPKKGIPDSTKAVKEYMKTNDIIFCGALEYKPGQTTDTPASELARDFKTIFINLTNVSGLYNKNPKKHKDAKLIPQISWKDFRKITNKIKFKSGQNFVLDQKSSKIIEENKIPTYLIGKDLKQLENILNEKEFKGTLIKD